MAYHTGRRIVEMAHEELRPSDIMTRDAFLNAIVTNTAIGGSTNAPPHLQAIARHVGVELSVQDWQTYGYDVPLLLNMQPAGEYLGESFHRAGGVPAVMGELAKAGLIRGGVKTVTGKTMAENLDGPRKRGSQGHHDGGKTDAAECGFRGGLRQPVRHRDHENQRDLGRFPQAVSANIPAPRISTKARRSCLRAPSITTPRSTIRS